MHVFDDFREAYSWLRHNTPEDAKVKRLHISNCQAFSGRAGQTGKHLWSIGQHQQLAGDTCYVPQGLARLLTC